jgi:hypothetical protein
MQVIVGPHCDHGIWRSFHRCSVQCGVTQGRVPLQRGGESGGVAGARLVRLQCILVAAAIHHNHQ